MQNIADLFPQSMHGMVGRAQEIKYSDEMDYAVEGLMRGDVAESLDAIATQMQNEGFKAFIRESGHLDEVVCAVSGKPMSGPACTAVLRILSQVFNPYSFGDLEGLFKVMVEVLGELLDTTQAHGVCIKSETRAVVEILQRIPIRWYPGLCKCMELEKLVFAWQVCVAKGVVGWSRFLCSVLAACPGFELSDQFVGMLLRQRRGHEVLVRHTTLEANVTRLSLSLSFRECLQDAVAKEFSDATGKESKKEHSGRPTALVETGRARPAGLRRKRSLVMVLINLVDKSFSIDIPLALIAKAYYSVDRMTRCYIAVLLLISSPGNEGRTVPQVCREDLWRDAGRLLSAGGSFLSEGVAARLGRMC